ncbi:prolipoprotein diacylglyceryl transferase [Chitinispirillales bacterium ANBcel5]|uniref:prolipoprotein diacylglyceryl transferase n=1 Tax=Cellulosispirillum alkaliphilum TaxID=3039283 RepID=UPI002A527FC6|nr:prolipoprotein diacylglyceryl transferase [Chitinispirillales bacterium ANBcel5]
MQPVLFDVFSFPIPSYGLMLALSFLVGIWLASWRAGKMGLNSNLMADVGFYVIISAIVGSRLYYVFLHYDKFRGNIVNIFNPFQDGSVGIDGLVMYGGVIGAIIAAVLFFKIKKAPFLPYADAAAPSLGIGIFLTRIGCFLNGCCYGAAVVAERLFSVSYPHNNSPAGSYQAYVNAHALEPSQIYESVGGLVMALIVLAAGRMKTFAGFQFYLAGLLYSVLRFFVDYSRVYTESEYLGPFTHNQVICIVFFILFGTLILKKALKNNSVDEQNNEATTVDADEQAKVAVDQN